MRGFSRKWMERAVFALLATLLLFFGGFQGFQVISFQFDVFTLILEVVFLEAVASSAVFTGFILVSALLLGWRLYRETGSEGGEAGGKVTAVVPVYRDGHVLENSVESLEATGYPGLETVIVCEEDDGEGLEMARELASGTEEVRVLVNQGEPSKAGAINHAIEETDSDYVAVFDADQRVPENFFSRLIPLFPEYDAVAARKIPEPEGGVESIAYYESVLFNYLSTQLLYSLTRFRMLSSRGIVVKRSVLEELDGFSPDVLTEDYDFSHRFYINGFQGKEVTDVSCTEQAAHGLGDWWGQRKRWMKGYFEVTAKMAIDAVSEFRNGRSLLSVMISALTVAGGITMLTLVSKFVILLILGARFVYLPPVIVVMAVALAVKMHDKSIHGIEDGGSTWILSPLIYPAFSMVTLKALTELLIQRDTSWYRARKN